MQAFFDDFVKFLCEFFDNPAKSGNFAEFFYEISILCIQPAGGAVNVPAGKIFGRRGKFPGSYGKISWNSVT